MKNSFRLIMLAAATAVATTVSAQIDPTPDPMIFNHLSAGVEVGTTGIGLEVAMPCTRFLAVRTGVSFMPRFSFDFDIDYKTNKDKEMGTHHDVNVKGEVNMLDWKLLADFYPVPKAGFHITAGFFLGKEFPIEAKNTNPLEDVGPGEGIEIGNTIITPDENMIARVNIATRKMKPYVGIGYGRAVPKRRVNFAFDLGAQFWGKPAMKAYSIDEDRWVKVSKGDVDEEDLNDAIDIIEKIVVYPVLNFRVNFRAF